MGKFRAAFEDATGVITRLSGELEYLPDPVATPGDVLTVQADGSVAAAPGGGSMPFAAVEGVNLAHVGNGVKIPFDTVVVDADGFWDAANTQFTVPAGKGGLYRASLSVDTVGTDADPGPIVVGEIMTSGPFLNIAGPLGTSAANEYMGALSGVLALADGDSVTGLIGYTGLATDLAINSAVLSLQRIGDV